MSKKASTAKGKAKVNGSKTQGRAKPVRKRDRGATINKLLCAGLEVFSKYGFDAATTQMVAKKAGVNEALISRYFEGKSGLLTAIIIQFLQQSEVVQVQAYPTGATLEEEIYNFMIANYEEDCKNRDFLRVAISRSAVDAKMRKEVDKHIFVDGNPFLAERLETFQKRGEIAADVDLFQLSHMLTCQCIGFMFIHCMMGNPKPEAVYKSIKLAAPVIARGLQSN